MDRREFLNKGCCAVAGALFLLHNFDLFANEDIGLRTKKDGGLIFDWSNCERKGILRRQEAIETLILEAASEYKSTHHVQEALDFMQGENTHIIPQTFPKDIRFSRAGKASYRCADKPGYAFLGEKALRYEIRLNDYFLKHEGLILCIAFHEFSHIYDWRQGLFPETKGACKEIAELVAHGIVADFEAGKTYWESQNKSLLNGLSKEGLLSEIKAYERQLNYLPEIKNRDWPGNGMSWRARSWDETFVDTQKKIVLLRKNFVRLSKNS